MKKLLLLGLMTCAIAGLHAEPPVTDQGLENNTKKAELPSRKRLAARLVGQAVAILCGKVLWEISKEGRCSPENERLYNHLSGYCGLVSLQLLYKNFKDGYVRAKSLMNADQTAHTMSCYAKKIMRSGCSVNCGGTVINDRF
ncbi:hypothetical protein IPH25_00415 [bacterium]|nr:MAG: hypothetical protein IPG37_02530 [bacterium]QQR61897.1 MAG: hypothetical protein IPH25_00415 [bacterium]QQR62517.1 MAG: hypothetical protein IPH67_03795 [bacterium]